MMDCIAVRGALDDALDHASTSSSSALTAGVMKAIHSFTLSTCSCLVLRGLHPTSGWTDSFMFLAPCHTRPKVWDGIRMVWCAATHIMHASSAMWHISTRCCTMGTLEAAAPV